MFEIQTTSLSIKLTNNSDQDSNNKPPNCK